MPEDTAPEDEAREVAAAQGSAPEDPAPPGSAPENAASKNAAPAGPAPEGSAPENTASKDAATEGSTPEAPTPQDPAPASSAPENTASKNAAPEGAAPAGPAPEGWALEGPAPENAASKNASPTGSTPEASTPQDPAPASSAPENTASKDAAIAGPAPEGPALEDAALEDAASKDSAPRDAAPRDAVPGDEAWLPEPLVRLIAERSAAGLALPGVDDTEIDTSDATVPSPPTPEAPGPGVGRRRFLLLAGGAAAAGGGALAVWGTPFGGDGGSGAAPDDSLPLYTIGLHADLSGDQKAVGRAQERGLRVAVDEFNARKDARFALAVKAVDDGGDPARAPVVAKRLVADRTVLAVVGPTTDTTGLASLATYDAASLPLLAVTPGATVLDVTGSRSFLHARVTDTILPFYLNAYLRGTAKSRRIGIVDDRAADTYGWEISSTLTRILRDDRQPSVPKVVSALRTDFAPTLDALLDGGADSVVFAGYHDRAALLARELTRRDFPGARAAGQGVLDARFLSAAGDAAEGWAILAPVMDAATAPEAKAFAAAHRKLFHAEPERYSVETYDVAQLVLRTLGSLAVGRRTRARLTTALRAATYKGISRNFAFDKTTGALVVDGSGIYLWKVTGGRFVYQGVAPYQVST
ncbi:ABC transporter substrate-binding protein [Streptomyces sp. NPDC005811]|uniref:branched-chain amino acid ABC transporter substrate-binding protein n=1 Tax=Streptomyces sp. NPDC005811 TaxID=3154565 RepID=UPI0033CEE9EF